jgi:hypothetical protein
LRPAPRKSLVLQEGRITLPGVTPVLGRSDAVVTALLAGPAASMVVAHSVPPVTQVTAPDMGWVELEAAVVVFDGAA